MARRFVATMTLTLLTLALSAGAVWAQQTTPQVGHGVTDPPTPIPGTNGARSATAEVISQGEAVDTSLYAHWSGNESRAERFTTYVVRNSDDWWELWRRLGKDDPMPYPRNRIAVGIFIGPRPTEGYNVRITGMRLVDDGLVVTYIETKPNTTSPARMTPSSPWVVMMAPRVEGRVRFVPQMMMR